MISTGPAYYLKNVLGVSSVIAPETFFEKSKDSLGPEKVAQKVAPQLDALQFSVLQNPNASVGILVSHPLDSAQKTLAEKILAAAKINQPLIVMANVKAPSLLSEIKTQTQAKKIIHFGSHSTTSYGSIQKEAGIQVLYTFSLDSMLSGSPDAIQNCKKQVWNHVRSFLNGPGGK